MRRKANAAQITLFYQHKRNNDLTPPHVETKMEGQGQKRAGSKANSPYANKLLFNMAEL